MKAWITQHRAALASAFRRLWATPFNTLLSLLAIGIALTLPALGYVLLDNLRELGRNASSVQELSVFMNLDAGKPDIAEIENRLRSANASQWRFVPKEDALKRIQASEEMAEIVASLPRNPLPDAFVIQPANTSPEALEVLRKELASWPKVAHVQLDSAWIRRFDAFLRLGKLALTMLAGLFAAGLTAVTFNTIRLQVMGHAAEIEVAKMIGATDAFIKHPFQYYGALQGAFGGLLAGALTLGSLWLLAPLVAELSALYGGNFQLRAPGALEIAALAGIGALLGWIGAQLSVSLSLRRFD